MKEDKIKAKEEKEKKKLEKLKEKKEKKGSKLEKEFKEPPLNIIISLLGGLKLEIKRIHIRYEDDYY
jgi:hypothetical protein